MARFTRTDVIVRMRETGIIPIFYHKDIETCRNVIKASFAGGLKVFEFTNRGDFAHEVFSELNKWAEKEVPELIMGVGSVVDAGTTSLYIQLGANFIVSPLLNADMARVCNRRKILWTPGCGSVSEISYAEELGADIIKIFPGSSVGGPDFIKSVKGPCPWTSLMPTGGVEPTIENLKSWYDAGAVCVGMGSNLITKDIIAKKDWDGLSEKIAATLKIAQTLRKK
ncbi:MAG TPA: bifunctional 4-hydroxy-2-oxoglutarate aldolase/2-dehydro-3-deoxy-phosphogluconate aldolase [Bacteroidales bacterium]|nr:bifunctional 4-hydroxy-2-oxoglutarate aldolase/2-dehydro-3-deoxy-phosphogluconate aldolase [Bacteroidales bacterium]HOX74966.1 bifunctional 4-hydroxy-2-oxoglutarate aldolase/2-dehydro-3-deoxy-phosphogluconate aldolase [Bacteroidales bacterium]HPM88446.1 bifunctional 4-hydroxy-2-oxoglutarate aldolase/2-dehydro-3-deoxy-phosphogluconate aldolase [Bacteroidales bacterium]HQM69521.1 bifunctional 4-hydroxy-2-oxoglutarate aldolase/2-dehydro-3-deoxy-phosphogluconate aldolase [Bacteroidales bacterium]